MMATAAQLDAVTTVNAKRAVYIHNINAITVKHKLIMKDSHVMR